VDSDQEWRAAGLASGQFDVFVTVDRNLALQQNLDGLPIAVVVLQGKSNRLSNLRPLVQGLLSAVNSIQKGQITVVAQP
jgi:hypothetical protein